MDLGAIVTLLKLLGESGLTKADAPPSTTGWEVLTGAGVRNVEYTGLGLDPAAVAAWREEQARVQAMHEIKALFK